MNFAQKGVPIVRMYEVAPLYPMPQFRIPQFALHKFEKATLYMYVRQNDNTRIMYSFFYCLSASASTELVKVNFM